MTTPATGRKLTSACDGVSRTFTNPKLLASGDLKVYLLNAATDANSAGTLLSEGADYALAADLSTITTTATYALGKFIRRWRSTSRKQGVEIVASAGVPAATQEGALDRLSLVDEEQDDDVAALLAQFSAILGDPVITNDAIADQDIGLGALVNLYVVGAVAHMRLADGSVADKPAHAFCGKAVLAGEAGTWSRRGIIPETGATPFAPALWLSQTVPGAWQSAVPANTPGMVSQLIGMVLPNIGVDFNSQPEIVL